MQVCTGPASFTTRLTLSVFHIVARYNAALSQYQKVCCLWPLLRTCRHHAAMVLLVVGQKPALCGHLVVGLLVPVGVSY